MLQAAEPLATGLARGYVEALGGRLRVVAVKLFRS